jgi:hypothetical protein
MAARLNRNKLQQESRISLIMVGKFRMHAYALKRYGAQPRE